MVDHSAATPGLTPEDRSLIQALGSRLRRIINHQDIEVVDVDRRDELGILANMVNRVAKELRNSRRRDEQQRNELARRLTELQTAHDTQQRLVATIKELSTPILNIYNGVVLVPLIGSIDDARAQHTMNALLEAVAARQARIVILDTTGVVTIDTQVANVLLQTARAVELLGARVLLCGISPEIAQVVVSLGIDLKSLTLCHDVQTALQRALQVIGFQIIVTPSIVPRSR